MAQTPGINPGWGMTRLGVAMMRTWRCWWVKSWTWDSNVLLQPRIPNMSCIKSSVGSRSRDVILPLYSFLMRSTCSTATPENHGPAQVSPQGAINMIRGMEHLPNDKKLRESGLFIPEKRRGLFSLGPPNCGLVVPEGSLQERQRGTVDKSM